MDSILSIGFLLLFLLPVLSHTRKEAGTVGKVAPAPTTTLADTPAAPATAAPVTAAAVATTVQPSTGTSRKTSIR